MELTLKRLLEQATFTKTRKGYDQDEVDAFLDRAVAMAAKVEIKLTEAMEAAKSAPPAAAPVADTGAGGPSQAAIEAEVERRVSARMAAVQSLGPSEDDTAEEVKRTLVLAQRTADAAIREAREDAAKLLADAQERAAAVTADAEAEATSLRSDLAAELAREREAARAPLTQEIAGLEGTREALKSDVSVLERHVSEQRGRLRESVADLQRLLDQPGGFRVAPSPALLEATAPAPGAAPSWTPAPAGPDEDAQGGDAAGDDDGTEGGRSAEVGGPEGHEPTDEREGDAGPPTMPVSATELGIGPEPGAGDADEDEFLDELRRAMVDDEPAEGEGGIQGDDHEGHEPFGDDDDGRRPWRFGKRR